LNRATTAGLVHQFRSGHIKIATATLKLVAARLVDHKRRKERLLFPGEREPTGNGGSYHYSADLSRDSDSDHRQLESMGWAPYVAEHGRCERQTWTRSSPPLLKRFLGIHVRLACSCEPASRATGTLAATADLRVVCSAPRDWRLALPGSTSSESRTRRALLSGQQTSWTFQRATRRDSNGTAIANITRK
jgi:hypothetical protein